MRRRRKYIRVDVSREMTVSDRHDAIMRAAALPQAFYNSNHNLEKSMDIDMRGRGSDDGASAVAAHGEPVQKALKTK